MGMDDFKKLSQEENQNKIDAKADAKAILEKTAEEQKEFKKEFSKLANSVIRSALKEMIDVPGNLGRILGDTEMAKMQIYPVVGCELSLGNIKMHVIVEGNYYSKKVVCTVHVLTHVATPHKSFQKEYAITEVSKDVLADLVTEAVKQFKA